MRAAEQEEDARAWAGACARSASSESALRRSAAGRGAPPGPAPSSAAAVPMPPASSSSCAASSEPRARPAAQYSALAAAAGSAEPTICPSSGNALDCRLTTQMLCTPFWQNMHVKGSTAHHACDAAQAHRDQALEDIGVAGKEEGLQRGVVGGGGAQRVRRARLHPRRLLWPEQAHQLLQAAQLAHVCALELTHAWKSCVCRHLSRLRTTPPNGTLMGHAMTLYQASAERLLLSKPHAGALLCKRLCGTGARRRAIGKVDGLHKYAQAVKRGVCLLWRGCVIAQHRNGLLKRSECLLKPGRCSKHL